MSAPRKEPVPHAATTERVLKELREATPQELRKTFVRAGIVTADGVLKPAFGGPPPRRRSKKAA